MFRNDRNKKLLMIVGGVIAIILLFVLLAPRSNIDSTKPVPPPYNSYTDPSSGETIDQPDGKTPELYGVNQGEPVYLGFSKLIANGLSTEQLLTTKYAFQDYFDTNKLKTKEVSISVDEIRFILGSKQNGDDDASLKFPVTFDRTNTHQATLVMRGGSSIQLILIDSAGRQVYDSGFLDQPPIAD